MIKLDHIGIAVNDLKDSIPLYEKLLSTKCYKIEEVVSEKVVTAFFKTGESKIELLEAKDNESVISAFISKKGEGLHHIAFEVQDIYAEMKRLKEEGFQLLSDEPKVGADHKMICFLHPKTTNGVLIEICQNIR